MRSGWWWGTHSWQAYLQEYAAVHPECLSEWKTSPLANDHDFSDTTDQDHYEQHIAQVIDLENYSLSHARKGCRSDIKRAKKFYDVWIFDNVKQFQQIHFAKFGYARPQSTFDMNDAWLQRGNGFVAAACNKDGKWVAAAMWFIYQRCAYYASGPSLVGDVQSSVIYESLLDLKKRGVRFVDMGQIDGETEKEKKIGNFKAGFGGERQPFTIVKRRTP